VSLAALLATAACNTADLTYPPVGDASSPFGDGAAADGCLAVCTSHDASGDGESDGTASDGPTADSPSTSDGASDGGSGDAPSEAADAPSE